MPHFAGKITPRGNHADAEFGVQWTKKHYTKLAGGSYGLKKGGKIKAKRRRR